ncbi:hypothetical protein ADL30_20680 [Streptomyces sp. NRRL S-1521]|nr:hypothetical protein ADL30_20680 [Streptomyces sp. NRRL S-1521]
MLTAQDLTATTLIRLRALDSSPYTSVPGSRTGLECLASVLSAASLASSDLTSALSANPYEGTPFPGHPADDATVRTTRQTEAIPKMTRHLADAAHQLDLSATGCHYLATGITRALAATRTAAPSTRRTTEPALTSAQFAALQSLARGGGRLYESSQRGLGVTRVAADDGTRISIATFRALAKRGLVHRDTSTSLFHGQKITVTAQGRHALAQPRPHAAPPTPTATAAKTTTPQGVRR